MKKLLTLFLLFSFVLTFACSVSAAQTYNFYSYAEFSEALVCDFHLPPGKYRVDAYVVGVGAISQDVSVTYKVESSGDWVCTIDENGASVTIVTNPKSNRTMLAYAYNGQKIPMYEGSYASFEVVEDSPVSFFDAVALGLGFWVDSVGVVLSSFLSGSLYPLLLTFSIGCVCVLLFFVLKNTRYKKGR